MAKQTTEAIITLNGKQPIEVLNQMHSAAEKIKAEMEKVQQKMKGMSPKDDAYKQLKGSLKELKGQYDLLSSAQVKDIEATKRLQAAVDNLASTSLKDLRKALGDGKRQIEGLSEAELEQANTIRSLMKTVGDQVRLLEGKFVKIREGLASIGTQSDQWLGKAIAQQQELMAVTRRGTKEYKEQEQVMQMLTDEQNKRNAAISAEATARRQAQFKQQVASSRQMLSSGDLSKYSSSEVQTSINTLKQAQSQAAMGGSEWQRLAAEIKKAEDELDRLLGKTKEVKQQMSEGDARSILGNIGGHTEQEVREAINALKLLQSTVNVGGNQWNAYAADIERAETELGKLTGRVKEAKQGLSMNDVESRMQNLNAQSERSLKEMLDYLQKAKAELAPYSQQWKDVATQIDAVKERMANVQAAMPYVHDETAAQFIARNDRMDFGNGTTHDITRKDLQWSKDFLQKQLDVTPVADTAKIQQIQEALGLIDERIKALNGDTEKSAMSTEKLNEVLGNIKTASLEELRDASAELKKQLDGLAPSSSAAKQVKKQMQDLDREIKQVEDDMVDVNDVIARSKNGKASISELKKAYKQLEDELNHLDISSKEFTSKRKDLEALRDKIDEVTVSVHKQRSAWQTALKNLTAYVGLFGAFNMIKTKMSEIINLNLKLSDQLADIRKVSGWAMSDVNELSKRLAKIDTRNTIQQMNDLAYQGAKLGIGKYGVDGLTRFAEATAQIRMALHEDMGDEAIAQLAKMAEVMGDMEHMGVSQSLLASGSAIFKLSATTTACGSNIMEFSKRLLGLGKTADLTTPQILALGSAADSMALMPEVASTAFNKFITTLQSKYGQVAKAVGMNQDRLKSLLDQHKTMEAIVEVLEHMRDMGDLNALAPIMGDLGSEGARLTNVFASMASNVDILKEHLATSEDEFEKATAVTAEFDIQNETSQALIERANNIWEKSFVNSDNAAGGIHDIAAAWYDMTKAITESLSFMGEAGLLLKSLTVGIQVLIGALPALINGLMYFGMVKLVGWAQLPIIINSVTAAAGRAGTAILNLVGIHTASQRSAIATARANQATAESMYLQAVAAQEAALANQANAATQEEVAAANAAVVAANAELTAAQQMLATSTMELSAATGTEAAVILESSQYKMMESALNKGLASDEILLTESKGMATAMTNAQTAAIERETVAKEANATATKNMRLAWGAILFISLISLLDKFYEGIKKVNKAEEDQKDITEKISNGLVTANEEFEKASKNLRVLYGELERNFGQMEERQRLIGEINSKYGEYIGYLDVETLTVGNLKRSYNDATDALREYYFYKQKEALETELVTEQKHKAAVSIIKLGQMPKEYSEKANVNIIETLIEEYARQGLDSSEATDRLFKTLYPQKKVPSHIWFNLKKLPLIGGMFSEDMLRSDAQKAMAYLNEAVRFIYTSLNNKATIEKSFPGEYKPKPKPKKHSVNHTKPDASKPEDDARNNISEFVTKIKNFYERQKTATIEYLTEKNVEKELQEQALAEIEKKEAAALVAAQQSIVLGNNAWAKFSPSMDHHLVEKDDEFGQSQSRMLKDAVQGVNTKKLRADLLKHMPKIKKGKVVGEKSDESDRAYLDKRWLEASQKEREQATIEQKRMAERQKELLEHSYTGVVKHNAFLGLATLGYANVDLANVERDKAEVFKVLEKSRQDLAALYATGGDKDRLLTLLFGEGYKDTPEVFKSLLKMSEADARLFYQKLIQYSDEYTAAEKKRYDDAKKYANQIWANTKRNLDNQEKLRQLQSEGKLYDKRNNFLSNLGLKDVPADPAVVLMKARMRAAQDYYAFILANSKNMQLVRDADKARQEAELAYANQMATAMKSRLSQMQSLVQPIKEFGSAVGQALAEMKNDADSANQAIKNALKSMLESWAKMALNDVNTQMRKAINDAGVKKAKDKAQPDIKAGRKASANAAANGELNIPSDLGTAANPVHAIIDAMPLSNLGKDDGTGENGTGVPFADTKSGGNVKPVSTEHSPSGKTSNAPASPTTAVSPAATNVASQTGEAAASVATGQSTLGEAAVGMAGSAIGTIMDTDFGSKQSRREKREQRKQQREAKKHQKELTKETQQGVKERETINKKGNKEITKSTEEESKAQVKTEELKQNTTNAIVDTALNTNFQLKKNNDQQVVEQSKNTAQAENTFSIVGAVGKCFEFLGPIAGPIAAAAVMALLTGLMQWGLNAAFGGGKNKSNNSSSKNTKLVPGMLTYDSGNVQDMKPFVGDNGKIYWAREQDKPKSSVNLLTTPTATTINGQRALVAENGPELVIGRETTKAMMMNNPSLLKALVNYDANYSGRNAARRAFDEGNLAEALGNLSSGASATDGLIADSRAANIALITAINTLMQRLDQPIHAKIDMYGRGNLYDSMSKANQFMKGKS